VRYAKSWVKLKKPLANPSNPNPSDWRQRHERSLPSDSFRRVAAVTQIAKNAQGVQKVPSFLSVYTGANLPNCTDRLSLSRPPRGLRISGTLLLSFALILARCTAATTISHKRVRAKGWRRPSWVAEGMLIN